jgi:hypothetical protein
MTRFSGEEKQKTEQFIQSQTKNLPEDATANEKLGALADGEKKVKRFMLINVVIVAFFFYGMYTGITQLSQTWIIILIIVFGANLGMFFWQRKQFEKATDFLENQK